MGNLKRNKWLKFVAVFLLSFIIFSLIEFIFLLYGPYTYLKDLFVTSAVTTKSHQYLAKLLYSDYEINEIMSRNFVIESDKEIDLSKIKNTHSKLPSLNEIIEEKKKELAQIEKIDIEGEGFKGKLLIIHDPSRIYVGTSNNLFVKGEKLLNMVKREDAIAGINAGAFYDKNWEGNGGEPEGLLISKGTILKGVDSLKYSLIGFNYEDKLVLGKYTLSEIKEMQIRDAVSFLPFIISNGEPAKIVGNGGWGIAPRTAIGQRQDGTVLLLAIDGRQVDTIGASIKQLQDIMIIYGAVNAANLDGGSSTTMVYEGEIINKPCSEYGPRSIPDAFLVKK